MYAEFACAQKHKQDTFYRGVEGVIKLDGSPFATHAHTQTRTHSYLFFESFFFQKVETYELIILGSMVNKNTKKKQNYDVGCLINLDKE